jgi:hypothetical protein
MTGDLFFSSSTGSADFAQRAVSPRRELGAYEALWAREGTSFKSLARDFPRPRRRDPLRLRIQYRY